MTTQTAFAVAAALIAIAMGASTYERWQRNKRDHELTWTFAFACFAIASFALALGARHGFNGFIFRTFYLFGAIVNVPLLALGTIQLHSKNIKWSKIVVYTFVAFSAGVIISTPFRAALPSHELVQGSKVFGALPRILAAVGSGVASIVIIGGAVRSAVRRVSKNLTIGNIYIAAGTLVTGASGLLNSAVGAMTAFAISLALGISIIFVGFLYATTPSRSQEALEKPRKLAKLGDLKTPQVGL